MMKKLNFESMIRVNQAGEYGATRIYQGQIDAIGNDHNQLKDIQHMMDQEKEHLKEFNKYIVNNNLSPTSLQPIWHIAGYAMGYISGKLGINYAHACTEAVEEVIDDHYKEQISELENYPEHNELSKKIEKFRQEELEHKKIARDKSDDYVYLKDEFKTVIKYASKLAIFLSKKI